MAVNKPEWTKLLLYFLLYFLPVILAAFAAAVVAAFFAAPILDGIEKASGTTEMLYRTNNVVLFCLMLFMQLLFFLAINSVVERKTNAISKVVEYCFGKSRVAGIFIALSTAAILALFSYFAVTLIQFSAL